MIELRDPFGRQFRYLRLSVTDACNFRCVYCLPNGYRRKTGAPQPLSVSEIANLVSAFGRLGVRKVRLTGGEPTLRRDIVELAAAVSRTPGIEKVALSTNGYRLKYLARELKDAGVSAINVSVDSLDPERFHRITGHDGLDEVLTGVDAVLGLGFSSVKLNAVLLRDLPQEEVGTFIEFARKRPLSVRFIELMRTGENQEFFEKSHLSMSTLQAWLLEHGWTEKIRESDGGPALELVHPEYLGSLGLIAPYSKDFCASCNRLRVTSQGKLRLCLFGEADYSLRPLLASESHQNQLIQEVLGLLSGKPASHLLSEGRFGNTANLAGIGG